MCVCAVTLIHGVLKWFCRRRESVDVEDLFIAHILGMDSLARGLRNAAQLVEVRCSQSVVVFSSVDNRGSMAWWLIHP